MLGRRRRWWTSRRSGGVEPVKADAAPHPHLSRRLRPGVNHRSPRQSPPDAGADCPSSERAAIRRRQRVPRSRADATNGSWHPNTKPMLPTARPTAFRSCPDLDTVRRRFLSSPRMVLRGFVVVWMCRDRLGNLRSRERTPLKSRRSSRRGTSCAAPGRRVPPFPTSRRRMSSPARRERRASSGWRSWPPVTPWRPPSTSPPRWKRRTIRRSSSTGRCSRTR